jgi:hypothetical protein
MTDTIRANPDRVSPSYVRSRRSAGADTLLVCAYTNPDDCRDAKLDGSIDMQQLKALMPETTREIVFYCS